MSGKNPDTLEFMWLASFQQQSNPNDSNVSDNRNNTVTTTTTNSPFGSNSARFKAATLKGFGQQKRFNLHLNQRMRENKRLVSEINRLNDELAGLRKQVCVYLVLCYFVYFFQIC